MVKSARSHPVGKLEHPVMTASDIRCDALADCRRQRTVVPSHAARRFAVRSHAVMMSCNAAERIGDPGTER